jgi:hypothetical protein
MGVPFLWPKAWNRRLVAAYPRPIVNASPPKATAGGSLLVR